MENKSSQVLKVAAFSIAALVLAAILTKTLLAYAQIDLSELLADVQNLPSWVLVFVTVGMLFNIMLGAQNWRLTIERVSAANDNKPNYLFYLAYSSMSAILGLFIPIQISNLIIRSLSLKLLGNASTQKSTVTALVSQIHDVTVSMVFLIPGIMVLFGKADSYQWLLFEFLLVAGMYILFSRYTFIIVQNISALKLRNRIAQNLLNILKEGMNVGLFDNNLMAGLYRNSLIKFVILALRAYIISSALGLATSPIQIVSIFSALQLSIVFTITPGNLGVIEWGWVGLLVYTGISTYAAGNFALTLRALGYSTTALVFAGIMAAFLFEQKTKKI